MTRSRNDSTTMRAPRFRRRAAFVLVSIAAGLLSPLFAPTAAQATSPTDITNSILSDQNVTLTGDSEITLPAGTTTYDGVISGVGTLIVQSASTATPGTLVLTATSDFHLPDSATTETYSETNTYPGGCCIWVTTLKTPNPPVLTIAHGATVNFSATSKTASTWGNIAYVPSGWNTPSALVNTDNYEVDGELEIDGTSDNARIGLPIISGSGYIYQPRNGDGYVTWAGVQPFTGSVFAGIQMLFGSDHAVFGLPHARALENSGSLLLATPATQVAGPIVYPQDIYEDHYGDDINFGPYSMGLAIMDGVYSYSDSGDRQNPGLSNPALNDTFMVGASSYRGVNIEGANVQWGDGTTDRFFLPGNNDTTYIDLRSGGTLTLDYNGPTTLATSICGGGLDTACHNAPGQGNLTIAATPGNSVTSIIPQNYNGVTTIGAGATLQLGDGTAGHDSSLLPVSSAAGSANNLIVNNGTLIIDNVAAGTTLPPITGPGTVIYEGPGSVSPTPEPTVTAPATPTVAPTSPSVFAPITIDPIPRAAPTPVVTAQPAPGKPSARHPLHVTVRKYLKGHTAYVAGSRVTVKASGLKRHEKYSVTISGVVVAKGAASTKGTVSRKVTIPSKFGKGLHQVVVRGAKVQGAAQVKGTASIETKPKPKKK